MKTEALDDKQIVIASWNILKKYQSQFASLVFVFIFLEVISYVSKKFFPSTAVILSVLLFILSEIFQLVVTKASLAAVRNQKFDLGNLFSPSLDEILNFLFMIITYMVIVVGGFLLLIVPGCIWSYRYMYAIFFVVDEHMTIKNALSSSAKITHGYKMELFGLTCEYVILFIAGLVAFFLGVIIALPVIWIARAYVFEKLKSFQNERVESTMFISSKDVSGQTS